LGLKSTKKKEENKRKLRQHYMNTVAGQSLLFWCGNKFGQVLSEQKNVALSLSYILFLMLSNFF
jgi:hypothetical protein